MPRFEYPTFNAVIASPYGGDLHRMIVMRHEYDDPYKGTPVNKFIIDNPKSIIEDAHTGYLMKKFKVGVVHEVIGPVSQKLRFDMDIYKVDWIKQMDWTPEYLESYFNELIECIHEGFQNVYGRNLDPSSIVICDSTGDDKYSRHIIINGWYVINHTEAKYFYTKVMKLLEDRAWPTEFVYGQIYSAVQNFRMTGFTKRGRTKKIISNHTFSDTLITYIPDSKLLEQQCIDTTVTFAPIAEKFLMTLPACI
jgi:hypothetical protein